LQTAASGRESSPTLQGQTPSQSSGATDRVSSSTQKLHPATLENFHTPTRLSAENNFIELRRHDKFKTYIIQRLLTYASSSSRSFHISKNNVFQK
jgi:hypothetical protein